MHVVFMGTPAFAVPALRALTAEHQVDAVFTRPDAVRGRGRALVPSPVKVEAEALGIAVHEPRTLRDPGPLETLRDLAPDVLVVAAYGLILPPDVLMVAPHGAVNVHASLLPRWRGAAPVARAILAGDRETGVAIMRMEEGLDTGPYAAVALVDIGDAGVESLTAELAEAGAAALLDTLRRIDAGTVAWTPQDDADATYADKITSQDVALSPDLTADAAWRRVRAATDSAASRLTIAGTRVRALAAEPWDAEPCLAPGAVAVTRRGLVLGAADGGLLLTSLVPEGRKAMDAAAWARGARISDDLTWSAS